MLHILNFKHYLFFFPNLFRESGRSIIRFSHMRQPFPRRIGAFSGTEIFIRVTWSTYPREAGMGG